MYKQVEEYILLSREERRKHLQLNESCIEVGGAGSSEYKGLLAHHLKTTIPTKNRLIYLCHACNNPVCSNPSHLYWGTPKDNHIDQVENGTYRHINERMKDKYGNDYAEILFKGKKRVGVGGLNKLSEDDLRKYQEVLSTFDQTKRGWITKAANELNVSHTHIRRIVKRLNSREA